jgi:hypothetical protein
MKTKYNWLIFLLMIISVPAFSQAGEQLTSISESRNKNIKHQLDFRFKGGSGEFERVFFAHVEYSEEARKGCVMGVTIMSFKVSCDNKISDFRLKNPLGNGMNEKLGQFISATEGQWNTCSDEKYTKFEIPIMFIIENAETAGKGYLTVEGKYPGFKCKSDAYFLEEFEKLKSKKKSKKALHALDELIRRDPYNNDYIDLKKQFLNGGTETK